jgi:hypothetical protein
MIAVIDVQNENVIHMFIKWLCEHMCITPKSITIQGDPMLEGVNGLCIDATEDDFVILVKTGHRSITDVCITIAHEMIHVKQYMKENLGYWMDNCSSIPYMERWWEVEAFSKSVPLVEKFAKTL